jgi:hypothetical protein
MYLGVFWYSGFPNKLYEYRHFLFSPGAHGHGDGPAELLASVIAPEADRLLNKLLPLARRYCESPLTICREQDQLTIRFISWHFYDYDFCLACKIDELLIQEGANGNPVTKHEHPQLLYSRQEVSTDYPSDRFFQVAELRLPEHQAESLSLQYNCHLPAVNKDAFIAHIDRIAGNMGLEVFYYYEASYNEYYNLSLFFSNGRQGQNGMEKRNTGIIMLEDHMESAFISHSVRPGYAGPPADYRTFKQVIKRSVHW